MEHQIHFGRKFYLDKKCGYWISTDYPRIRAHVWVWINTNGQIEKDNHIHHIDGNKSNNHIFNLQKINVHDHLSLHYTEEKRQWSREWMEVIRPLTKEWHASEEGIIWHKEHGKKTWEGRKSFKINCLLCGKQIETKTYHQKFCHQNCKAKHRRLSMKGII